MGYDGVELACWGDHFDVDRAAYSKGYCREKWELLADHGLTCHAVSNHLVGQAVCDLIDERHRSILPPDVWGDGEARGRAPPRRKEDDRSRQGRAEFLRRQPGRKAHPAPFLRSSTASPDRRSGTRSTRSRRPRRSIGRRDSRTFARRFGPILEAFDQVNVNFGLEVHPTEIAFDLASAQRAVAAVKGHRRFGFNYDPSHLGYQGVDYVKFIRVFGPRIFHVHMKDVWWGHGDGSAGVFGGHTSFGDARRYWDFRSLGHGDIRFEDIIVALNDVGYRGPLSVEWEDIRMDRVHGAAEAAAFVRKLDFPPSALAFDAASSTRRTSRAEADRLSFIHHAGNPGSPS
jgi:sugar phosphate isomerase/epimerase